MKNKNCQIVPGRKGAIARLIIVSLISVIGLISGFGTIPQYAQRRGIGLAILEAFGGCGIIFLVAAFFWGLMKWIAVVAPKSFGFANRFWMSWHPYTFFGVYIKVCLWLILAVVPCSVFGFTFPLIFRVTLHFTQVDIGYFSAMALFFGGIAMVVVLVLADICKLRQYSFVAVMKGMLCKRKEAPV